MLGTEFGGMNEVAADLYHERLNDPAGRLKMVERAYAASPHFEPAARALGPLALASRLGGRDHLCKRPLGREESGWSAADSAPATLERARLTS